MKTTYITRILALGILTILFFSCSSNDDGLVSDPFVVAFESLSKNLTEIDESATIPLVYSTIANQSGTVTIQLNETNAIYGVDYTTIPVADASNAIVLSITAGETNNSIVFKKLSGSLDETTLVEFTITQIAYDNSNIQGNTSFLINSSAALGGSMTPEVGGPNEGNQVYIDLSSQNATTAVRDSWDLGFYAGEEFRVALNGSIYMAAKALDATDIDAVTSSDVSDLFSQVAVGTFDPANAAYVDATNGDILGTAIDEISSIDTENKVYLVNLGYEVGTATPTVGSAAVAGDQRGWKKIRILRSGDDYILQYADLDDTTHQEITISKNSDYNFSHFSFSTNTLVDVEPQKEKWDICFSVFTNVLTGAGSYGFSDFVFHNRKGNATAYQVSTDVIAYDDFTTANIDTTAFSEDQTTIGSTWRDVFSGIARADRFYIINDPNGNIYKLKFLALTNSDGERGYPEFEYELLQ